MQVKIKNKAEIVRKDTIINVTSSIGDYYLGTFQEENRKTPSTVRVKKQNCVILKN